MRPDVGRYIPASSLTSVVLPAPFSPTIGDDGAGRQRARRRRRAPAGRCRGSGTRRARSGCRRAAGRAAAAVARSLERGGVVLEPRQPQRRVEPDAAQEAELADRLGDVLRQPLAGDDDEHDVADAAVEAARRPTRCRRRRRRRTPPTPATSTAPTRQRAAAIGAQPRARARRPAGRAAPAPMPVTRTSLAGAAVVPTTNRWRARRSWARHRSSTARSTPGRHSDVEHGRDAGDEQQHERRVDRRQQHAP